MFNNQLERFRRGVQNIDADSIRPYVNQKKDEKGAEADTFRPRDSKDANGKTNGNFFPEYYVSPPWTPSCRRTAPRRRPAGFLIHNDVQVSQTAPRPSRREELPRRHDRGGHAPGQAQHGKLLARSTPTSSSATGPNIRSTASPSPTSRSSAGSTWTSRTAGSFSSAGMKEIDKAPKQRSEVTGKERRALPLRDRRRTMGSRPSRP